MQYTSWKVCFKLCFTFNFILCHSGLLCLWISAINSWPLKEIKVLPITSWECYWTPCADNMIESNWIPNFSLKTSYTPVEIYEILARIRRFSIISTGFWPYFFHQKVGDFTPSAAYPSFCTWTFVRRPLACCWTDKIVFAVHPPGVVWIGDRRGVVWWYHLASMSDICDLTYSEI